MQGILPEGCSALKPPTSKWIQICERLVEFKIRKVKDVNHRITKNSEPAVRLRGWIWTRGVFGERRGEAHAATAMSLVYYYLAKHVDITHK